MESFDDKNIFSEFEDEERRQLIEDLVRQEPILAEIPRSNFFPLWFSNIEVLRRLTSMNQSDDLAVSWRNCMLLNPVMGDVAGVCKCIVDQKVTLWQ